MRVIAMAALIALAVAGCASTSATTGAGSSDPGAPARGPSGGDWALSVVGTPFLLVFRTAVCASSLVLAAPISAMLALADSPEGLDTLSDGLAQNCGGPYVLAPGDIS